MNVHAAQVGKDFFLDEKIPRHELGQGYVRVVEQSIMWRETETSKVFTYQGLTTCTELDKSWTIMSSIYNHLRQRRDKSTSELKMFIPAEVELQERLDLQHGGCCGPCNPCTLQCSCRESWQLRHLPSSPVQGEAQRNSGAKSRGQQFSCGRVWTKKDEKNVKGRFARTKIGWCGVGRDPQKDIASSEGSNRKGRPSSRGK